ncbi:ATP-binding cassette domain-containing protein (plasmid) [Bacillus thuringiensis]|nr:ATP-binding cassette domain-containing protein [Bacillus thuringiensis]
MNFIEINSLSKTLGKKLVLNEINLKIEGTFGLLGPNGAGKTTLMRILATILPLETGDINYKAIDWSNQDGVRKLIGYLPQNFSMYQNVKLFEVLDHFSILKGEYNKEIRLKSIENILYEVNLFEQRNMKVKHLSGGMLRRLGIAQALIGEPKILIVDEPTVGLDVEERVRFRQLLRNLSQDRIVLISTHIVEDLESTCNNIAVLDAGHVLYSGNKQNLIDSVRGKVWEIKDSCLNSNSIAEKHIISISGSDEETSIKFFAEIPPNNAKEVTPNLEEAYLYTIRNKENV